MRIKIQGNSKTLTTLTTTILIHANIVIISMVRKIARLMDKLAMCVQREIILLLYVETEQAEMLTQSTH